MAAEFMSYAPHVFFVEVPKPGKSDHKVYGQS